MDRAVTGTGKMSYDIRVDGDSIFSYTPTLIADMDEDEEEYAFRSDVSFSDGSKVTCHITELTSGEQGENITIGLDLEEI